MQPSIMITNGGPHPADKWAAVSASQICQLIQIDQTSDSPEARAARRALPRLELDIADALEVHHRELQECERGKCAEHGLDRLSHGLFIEADHAEHVDAALAAVVAATTGTPFEAHFAMPEVQKVVRGMIGSHMTTSIDIERCHHADHNAGHEEAKAYHAARGQVGALNVQGHIHHHRAGKK